MFSTDLSTILTFLLEVSQYVLAIFALWYSYRCALWMAGNNAQSLSLRKLAELEAAQTELLDAYEALLQSHRKLRARIGMRQVREKRKNGEDKPDQGPEIDPDLAKAQEKRKLRAECKAKGLI